MRTKGNRKGEATEKYAKLEKKIKHTHTHIKNLMLTFD